MGSGDFENGYTLEVMGSTALVGKAPGTWKTADWGRFHRTFKKMTITPRQLAAHIWRGYAFTPVFTEARKEEYFKWAYHIAFDFDGENETSSLPYLMRVGTFAWMFASFGYATPSSTPEKPRSRLVFILDAPILSAAEFREVYQAVAWYIAEDGSYTDPACKDPLRLYYGSPRCEVIPNWSILGMATIEYITGEYRAAHPVLPALPVKITAPPPDSYVEIRRGQILDAVRYAPEGERHMTLLRRARQAGGFVASGYFEQTEIEQELIAAASFNTDETPATIERAVRDGIQHGMKAPLYFDSVRAVGDLLQ